MTHVEISSLVQTQAPTPFTLFIGHVRPLQLFFVLFGWRNAARFGYGHKRDTSMAVPCTGRQTEGPFGYFRTPARKDCASSLASLYMVDDLDLQLKIARVSISSVDNF